MNPLQLKKIAVIDIDGTLIKGQLQQGLINFLYFKRKISLAFVLKLNIWFIFYKLGVVKNIKNIFEFGVKYLNGKSIEELNILLFEYIDKTVKKRIFPKSFDLIRDLRSQGYEVIILSTAVEAIISKVANLFEITDYICTRLEITNGRYTGKIMGDVIYGEMKKEKLKSYFQEHNYLLSNAIAYADHESDIPMLNSVGKAYIVNPNAHMAKIASRDGIGIIETR